MIKEDWEKEPMMVEIQRESVDMPFWVIVSIEADSPEKVIERLECVLAVAKKYGKPLQGIELHGDSISQVVTPEWEIV